MAYADLTYYKTTYGGRSIVDAETTVFLERASDDIDMKTHGNIVLADLTTEQLTWLKKANCAQAEYYVTNGAEYNNSTQVQSAGIGKFSYSGKSSSGGQSVCSRAYGYLAQTGLLFAGLKVARQLYCD
jgi:hypothetical protein